MAQNESTESDAEQEHENLVAQLAESAVVAAEGAAADARERYTEEAQTAAARLEPAVEAEIDDFLEIPLVEPDEFDYEALKEEVLEAAREVLHANLEERVQEIATRAGIPIQTTVHAPGIVRCSLETDDEFTEMLGAFTSRFGNHSVSWTAERQEIVVVHAAGEAN